MLTMYRTGTEYVANEITMLRGTPADIVSVGVYFNTDPTVVPTVAAFTTVTLVKPGDPLADGTKVDVLSLIGPRNGQVTLTAGTYQRWVRVSTAAEDLVRPVDMIQVI